MNKGKHDILSGTVHHPQIFWMSWQVQEKEYGNQSVISQFLLLGLPIPPEDQQLFYALFLAMCLTIILGNIIIIILILLDSHLHTPMYLFLSNLSFSDLCFSSVTMPKLLQNMLSQDPSISYAGCLTQMYFLTVFGNIESFLLVVMAYDRYVAICFPLHYTSIMSPKLCVSLVVLSWVLTIFHAMLHTLLVARLSFCKNNVIPHFFCDISPLLKLSCSDTHVNELVIFIMGGLVIVIPFLLIVLSYVQIVSSIFKVPSVQGIHKVSSTCGSHLSVVSLFYGTIIGLYIFPSVNNSTLKEIAMAMMYTVVTPILIPFICSLRNRDMKEALERVLCKKKVLFCL
ncbi:olfactory receptor 1468-like [Peromyscus californicus insignis]|uniref:olfactory receptor 1468-like n=1 Tax=Peromyscus californicus insignis TaxID=564181 RepID=UPI0022A71D60|nr:olfactory receptor 1468-like [Peromyscus californicus insignis]